VYPSKLTAAGKEFTDDGERRPVLKVEAVGD